LIPTEFYLNPLLHKIFISQLGELANKLIEPAKSFYDLGDLDYAKLWPCYILQTLAASSDIGGL
jgi:hypothetical protein